MLIFDQLKHDDIKLRFISFGVLVGVVVLLSGLWWVQIVSAKRYEANLKNQSFRSVRVPALRGKILDCNGQSLAENRTRFDVNLYLEDIRNQFTYEYTNQVVPAYLRQHPELVKPAQVSSMKRFARFVTGIFGARQESPAQTTSVRLPNAVKTELEALARYRVVSNITVQITTRLQEPTILDPAQFNSHYYNNRYIPFPILQNLTPKQVAIFAENFTGMTGVEMEIQPMRIYPNGTTAAHLLGYIRRVNRPDDNDEINYKYYLPYYVGKAGVEGSFDDALSGKAGVKSLQINNIGYRQREEMQNVTEPGKNLVLTIDLRIQKAAEQALATAMAKVRGAVVVMDVRNGDILAMVSAPTYDPNIFPPGFSSEEWARLNDESYSHMFNRATYGAYAPGSILKILTSLACLESGVINPREIYRLQVDPERAPKGCIYVGRRKIEDTAMAGDYDFERAFMKSSNGYFIHYGLKAGLQRLVEIGERFHLGESTGLLPREEVSGTYPPPSANVPNLCIGQEVTVTPLQMAVMTSAIANGGKLFWPRIIKDLQTPDATDEPETNRFQPGILRADLHLNPNHVDIIHRAMLADVENPEGGGREAFMDGLHIGGKTGTAQVSRGKLGMDHITWFVSFAPYDKPKYAVVVMVQSGASGGGTCAPVAHKIYETISKLEQSPLPNSTVVNN